MLADIVGELCKLVRDCPQVLQPDSSLYSGKKVRFFLTGFFQILQREDSVTVTYYGGLKGSTGLEMEYALLFEGGKIISWLVDARAAELLAGSMYHRQTTQSLLEASCLSISGEIPPEQVAAEEAAIRCLFVELDRANLKVDKCPPSKTLYFGSHLEPAVAAESV